MNVKRRKLTKGGPRRPVYEKSRGREEERAGASKSQDMVAGRNYIVNKIIVRLRSNGEAGGNDWQPIT